MGGWLSSGGSRLRRGGVALFVAVAIAGPWPVQPQASSATESLPEQPNIVLVLTDDQTLDEMSAMPFLQSRPDGHWVEFTDAQISTPLCCPSRATFLSGQYSWHHNVVHNAGGHNLDDTQTVATWLDDAGYRTGLFGKYLNTYPFDRGDTYIPPGWDEWAGFIGAEIGYDSYTLNENGTLVTYGTDPADYSTDVLRDHAVEFIGEGSTEPFFMMFTPYAPHAPAKPPARYANTYESAAVPRSPNIDEADVSDKPAWVQELPLMTPTLERVRESRIRRGYAAVRAVDDAVEAIFEGLRTSGELDDTVVIFMSDNGNSFWSHRHAGKQCAYEECINTPLLVRYPGTEQRAEDALVSNLDIASTLAELAGVVPTIPQDGQSLVPLLDGDHTQTRDHLLLGVVQSNTIPDYWAIRTPAIKYIELKTGEKELYDLAADPYELDNKAGDPAYATEESALAYELDKLNSMSISVYPGSIEADGVSTATVDITVNDAAGVPQAFEPVSLATSGDVTVSQPVHVGNGVYRSTATASLTAGSETLTATLGPLTASATLTETDDLTVTSVEPASRARNSNAAPIYISGSGFATGVTVSFGSGVKVKTTRVLSPTLISVRVSVNRNAALGSRDVVVSRFGGSSATCAGCFTVVAPPTVSAVAPSSLPSGAAQEVEVSGTGLAGVTTITFGDGVTVSDLTILDDLTLRVSLSIDPNASPGLRTVTVTRPDGGVGTCLSCFSVD